MNNEDSPIFETVKLNITELSNQISKRGALMKIKFAVSNFLILVFPDATIIVCIEEKFLKIRVPRSAKMSFLTYFLLQLVVKSKLLFSKYLP